MDLRISPTSARRITSRLPPSIFGLPRASHSFARTGRDGGWSARERGPIGELVELIDAGDKVVVVMRRTGEDGQPELIANLTTFRDGKAIEMVHYPDPDDARAAAGL